MDSDFFLVPLRLLAVLAASILLQCPSLLSDDNTVAEELRKLGGEVVLDGGVALEVFFSDSSRLEAEHWKLIGQLRSLERLTAHGHASSLSDDTVGDLLSLQSLESLSTDGAQLSDHGLSRLAELQSLRSAAFFHLSFRKPGFTGQGFAAWTTIKNLERLTVAGMSMGDEGFAAIALLRNLRELRAWHTYRTNQSHQEIARLPLLTSLKLGQRLPGDERPVCLTDRSLEIIATIQTLERLEIGEASFTLAGLQQLSSLPKLRRLTIERTDLDASAIEQLRMFLPHVEIDFKPLTDKQRVTLERYLQPN